MAFKVFLTYSTDAEEQAIVWRLQTLAAAHGIQVYVPQRPAFRLPSAQRGLPTREVQRVIDECDCILAIVTSRTGPAVEKELSYALGRGKLIIPIVEETVKTDSFLSRFRPIFRLSRWESPGRVENEVLAFLRQQKVSKETLQAVGALVAIGVGMLLLEGLSKK